MLSPAIDFQDWIITSFVLFGIGVLTSKRHFTSIALAAGLMAVVTALTPNLSSGTQLTLIIILSIAIHLFIKYVIISKLKNPTFGTKVRITQDANKKTRVLFSGSILFGSNKPIEPRDIDIVSNTEHKPVTFKKI